jgi:hypothetical protein
MIDRSLSYADLAKMEEVRHASSDAEVVAIL